MKVMKRNNRRKKGSVKRIFSLILSFLIVFTVLPSSLQETVRAEGTTQKVKFLKNVKFKSTKKAFWGGTPYVIYEIDGIEYNSMNMGAEFNGKVWLAMNDDDRKKSLEFFTDKKDRHKWFGVSTGDFQAEWTNNRTGYKALCDESARRWEARYLGDLGQYYEGTPEEVTNKWNALTAFNEGTAAYRVMTEYLDDPAAKDFKAYKEIIPQLAKVGKDHYDNVKRSCRIARRLAVQSISKELISIIVDNFMTPSVTLFGPGAATQATTGVVTNFVTLTDTLNGFSGSLKEMINWEAVSLDDAVGFVNKFSEMVDEEVYIAEQAWEEAYNCALTMDRIAPDIIAAIEKRKNPWADTEAYFRQQDAIRRRKANSPSNRSAGSDGVDGTGDSGIDGTGDTGDAGIDSTGDSGIDSTGEAEAETGDAGDDIAPVGETDEEARIARLQAQFEQEYQSWASGVKSAAEGMVTSAGYSVPDDSWEDLDTHAQNDKKDYWRFGEISPHCYYDYSKLSAGTAYYMLDRGFLIPDYGLERWKADLLAQDEYNEAQADKLDSVISSLPELFNSKRESYLSLADRIQQADIGWDRSHFDNQASDVLNSLANMMPYDGSAESGQMRKLVENEMSEDGLYGRSLKLNQEQKEWIREALRQYDSAKSNFDLAYVEYCNDLHHIRSALNKAPDYAKKQAERCSDSTNMALASQGVIAPNRKNVQELKELIRNSNNQAWLLRTEGEKLRSLYGEYCSYMRQLEIDQAHMQYYKNEMESISELFTFHYVNDEIPGIPGTYGSYAGKTYLEIFGIDSNTYNPYTYDDPEYKVAAGSSGVVPVIPGEEESLRSITLLPSERHLGNILLPLYTDLLGGSEAHAEFMQIYNKMKSMRGTLLRQMKNENWTQYNEFVSQLESKSRSCEDCYNSRFFNPNRGGELDFNEVLYSDDGLVWKLQEEALNYIASKGLRKGGYSTNNISGINAVGDGEADLTLNKGRSGALSAEVYPENATDKRIIWESLDPEIAVADENGVVSTVSEGSARIRAYAADAPAEIVTENMDYNEVDDDDVETPKTLSMESYEIPEEFIAEFTVTVNGESEGTIRHVSFDGNGAEGSMDSVPVYEGDVFSLPAPAFTEPADCEFAGWDKGQPGEVILVNGDLTLKALWRELPKPVTVTVSFSSNGGSGSMDPVQVPSGDGYVLPSCSIAPPEGSKFLKWNLGDPGTVITVTEKTQLYPVWKEVKVCWISFDSNGGTGSMESVSANTLDTYVLPSCTFTPPEGYYFDRWNYGYEGRSIVIGDDILLVPQWQRSDYDYSDCYWVYFSAEDSTSGYMGGIYLPVGQSRRLPRNTFVREGYVFLGWDTEYPASRVVYTDEQVLTAPLAAAGETAYLYAVWDKAPCEHLRIELRNAKPATCLEDGYTGDRYCADCGIWMKDGSVISKGPAYHSREALPRDAKTATCQENGYTGDYYCSICQEKIETGMTIPKGPEHHAPEIRGEIKASCSATGYSGDTYCSICDKKLQSGEATGMNPANHVHTTVSGNIAPTCTKQGFSGDIWCADCHRLIQKGGPTAMAPHSFDEGVITRKPTYTDAGEKLLTCKNCGTQTTESMPCIPAPVVEEGIDLGELQKDVLTESGNNLLVIVPEKTEDGKTISKIEVGGKPVSEKVTKDGKTTETTYLWIGGLQSTYTYTGSQIKPEIRVYDGLRVLTQKADYTAAFSNNKEPGEASLTVKYKGNYAGTAQSTAAFQIEAARLGKDVIVRALALTGNSKAQKPKPEIVWASTGKPAKGKFRITYLKDGTSRESVQEPGDYIVRVEPDNDSHFVGTAEASLTVTDRTKLLSNARFTLKPASGILYTDSAIELNTSNHELKLGETTLVLGRHYRAVQYFGNTLPGKAEVVLEAIPGNGVCMGSKKVSFKILKGRVLTTEGFSFEIEGNGTVPYAKGGAKPFVAVRDNASGTDLVLNRDYTISYKKNGKVTTEETMAELTVKGKGNYKGSVPMEFSITPQSLDNLKLVVPDVVFRKGKAPKPQVAVYDLNGKKLSVRTDYLVDWSAFVGEDKQDPPEEAGEEWTITVYVDDEKQPNCNYTGRKSASFRYLDGKNFLNKAKAAPIASKEYTGAEITLTAEELNGLFTAGTGQDAKTLVFGKDFELSDPAYSKNIKKGKASVSFRGIGDYGGNKTVSFKIVQKNGTFRGQLKDGKMQ